MLDDDAAIELCKKLKPIWDGVNLWLCAECEFEEDVLDLCLQLFVCLFGLKDFTDSRWGTQHLVCGYYLALDTMGISQLVSETLANPPTKGVKWNLSGAQRINSHVRTVFFLAIKVDVVSCPPWRSPHPCIILRNLTIEIPYSL